MRWKKILFILIALVFVSGKTGEAKDITSKAERTLRKLTPYFSELKGSSLGKKTDYLDIDYKPGFHGFTINMKGEGSGYLIINKGGLLQEFSFSLLPAEAALPQCKKVARNCTGINYKAGEPEFIYLGPLHYLISFPLYLEGKEKDRLTLDALSKKVSNNRLALHQEEANAKKHKSSQKRKTSPPVILTEVPHYHYYLSEETTCLAMLFQYWGERDYPDILRRSPDTDKQVANEKELIQAINEGCAGCGEATAIEIFAASRGYHFAAGYYNNSSVKKPSFEIIKNEIDQKRPSLIRIVAAGLGHYAVVVGYWESKVGNFIACRVPALGPGGTEKENGPLFFFNWDTDYDDLYLTTIRPEPATGEIEE